MFSTMRFHRPFFYFDADGAGGGGNGNGGDAGDGGPVTEPSTPDDVEGLKGLVTELQATVKRLNAESADRRVKLKKLEDAEAKRLASEQSDIEKAQAQVTALTAERDTLTTRSEAVEEQMARYVAATGTLLDARIKALGKAAKTAVDALPEAADALQRLEWLEANKELFAIQPHKRGTPVPKTGWRSSEGDDDPRKGRRDFTARL